jgi:hypothetical protein
MISPGMRMTTIQRILKDEDTNCIFQNPEGTIDGLYCTFWFRKVPWEIQPAEDRKYTKIKLAGLYFFQNAFFYSKRWGSPLLHTISYNFPSYYFFHMIINNSSLFISMSHSILINIYHRHEKAHVNFLFHIHVGESRKGMKVVIGIKNIIRKRLR